MNDSGPRIRRVVPRAVLYCWVAGLIAVPLAWLWLDPLADAARIGLLGVPGLEGLMQVARPFGKFETQALMALIAFVVARRLRWRQARSWLAITTVAVLTTAVATNSMKLAVRRERPPVTSDQIDATGFAAVTTGKCMSFPSADTAAAFAIACVLAAYASRLRYVGLAVACLVGLSRVYFGAHYFSDVLAGALLGSLISGIVLARTRYRRVET